MPVYRYAVDRAEGELFVLVPDEGSKTLTVPKDTYALHVGDVVDVTLEADKICALTPLPEQTKERRAQAERRLHGLFAKGKKTK